VGTDYASARLKVVAVSWPAWAQGHSCRGEKKFDAGVRALWDLGPLSASRNLLSCEKSAARCNRICPPVGASGIWCCCAPMGRRAIPLEPIPGIDLLYDIGVPIVLIWYWYTFFRDARRITSDRSPLVQKQVTYRAWWADPGSESYAISRPVLARTPRGPSHSASTWP